MPYQLFDYIADNPIHTMGGKGGVTIIHHSPGRPSHKGPMLGLPDKNGSWTYVYGSDDKEVESAMDQLIEYGITGRR